MIAGHYGYKYRQQGDLDNLLNIRTMSRKIITFEATSYFGMQNKLNNRGKLAQALSTLLFFFLTPGALAEPQADTISFIHIADTHICNMAGYHPVIAGSRAHYGDGSLPLIDFFNTVPGKTGADFVVIAGHCIYKRFFSPGFPGFPGKSKLNGFLSIIIYLPEFNLKSYDTIPDISQANKE